jgi:ParB family chromosome partitioning protein
MRTEFIREYPIDKLVPADYNPRKLPEDKFTKLQESLKLFGIIKPLIVNGDNGVLTAGHQRTRAIKAVGIKTAPVIRIKGIYVQDEIRFNLFHNSIETDKSVTKINLHDAKVGDYTILSHEDITIVKNANAPVVKSICQLIVKYGEWGSVVCDEAGNVLLNSEYAVSAKLTKTDLIVYVIPDELKDLMLQYLYEEYGEYNYDTLGIKSYNQLYCQMNRLTKGAKKANRSSLYEGYVLPFIKKDMRILDFGAGKCAYVDMLQKQGFKAFAYEPNYQNSKNNIDMNMVVKMIRDIERDVEKNELYDVVVLDSVFNSVVSDEVENYVACICRLFLKPDGVFFTGTRNLRQIETKTRNTKAAQKGRELEFLDKGNFSATFRSGVWTMQHFHTHETLSKLLSTYYDEVEVYGTSTSTQIYAMAKKPKKIDREYAEKTLDFELNMEYPNNFRHNQHNRLKELILAELERNQ